MTLRPTAIGALLKFSVKLSIITPMASLDCNATSTLRDALTQADAALLQHLQEVGMEMGVDFLSTLCLRWLGCLMVRELPMHLCIRLWDTCIAESAESGSGGFANFLIYFCASLLQERSRELRAGGFDEIMVFVQHPPTEDLSLSELEATISKAYVLMSSCHERSLHCQSRSTKQSSK